MQALWQDGGYTYLDVRPKIEWDDIGHVRPAPGAKVVNVPIKHSKRVFDAKTRKKVRPVRCGRLEVQACSCSTCEWSTTCSAGVWALLMYSFLLPCMHTGPVIGQYQCTLLVNRHDALHAVRTGHAQDCTQETSVDSQVAQKSENPEFIAQVEKKFPDKDAKILIGCSDGRAYSMDALMALDEAGYTNIAGGQQAFCIQPMHMCSLHRTHVLHALHGRPHGRGQGEQCQHRR